MSIGILMEASERPFVLIESCSTNVKHMIDIFMDEVNLHFIENEDFKNRQKSLKESIFFKIYLTVRILM